MPFLDIGTTARKAGPMKTFTCTECGKPFERDRDVTHWGRRTRIYCSPECLSVSRHKRYVATAEARFWARVDVRGSDECWEWQGYRNQNGYGRASSVLFTTKQAHRIAYVFANGAIPKHLHACHHCDNPPCCNPDHLFAGTDAENGADRDAKGRTVRAPVRRGLAVNTTRLSAEIALLVVRSAEPNRTLAARYGVTAAAIYNIRHGRSWAHVTGVSRG